MSNSIAGPYTAFFYGTLMAPRVLHRVCHGPSVPLSTTSNNTLKARPALLKSYRRHRVKGADYPAIIPADGSTVRGTLVTGLTDGDIWRLDIFEGDEYRRAKVKVRVINDEGNVNVEPEEGQLGEEVEAETYCWIAGKQHLEESEWDFEEFVREKMNRWVGGGGEESGEYNEVDQAANAGDDKGARDPTGGRFNGSIATALEESRDKEKEVLESAV